jgi:hypothetical protein
MDIDGYNGNEFSYITQVEDEPTSNVQFFENQESSENIIDTFSDENKEFNQESNENMIDTFPGENREFEQENSENMIGTFPGENREFQQENMENLSGKRIGYSFLIFLVIWVLLGIIAFIASIVCFGFSGTIIEKIIGVVIACLFGPFYWLYFYFNKNYCGKNK